MKARRGAGRRGLLGAGLGLILGVALGLLLLLLLRQVIQERVAGAARSFRTCLGGAERLARARQCRWLLARLVDDMGVAIARPGGCRPATRGSLATGCFERWELTIEIAPRPAWRSGPPAVVCTRTDCSPLPADAGWFERARVEIVPGLHVRQRTLPLDDALIFALLGLLGTLGALAGRGGARARAATIERRPAAPRVVRKKRRKQIRRCKQILDGTRELERDGTLVWASPEMTALVEHANSVARTSEPVLILGPTGAGKGELARLVHRHSGRRPFVALNLAKLTPNHMMGELFGTKAGAFTDVRKDQTGALRQAHKGTLFLDEIGAADPRVQAALLNVIEEKTVKPLGGDNEIAVDVRFIAATNEAIDEAILEGGLREDFVSRLRTHELELPALCRRPEDAAALLVHGLGGENPARLREDVVDTFVDALVGDPLNANARDVVSWVARLKVKRAIEVGGRRFEPKDLLDPGDPPVHLPAAGGHGESELPERLPVALIPSGPDQRRRAEVLLHLLVAMTSEEIDGPNRDWLLRVLPDRLSAVVRPRNWRDDPGHIDLAETLGRATHEVWKRIFTWNRTSSRWCFVDDASKNAAATVLKLVEDAADGLNTRTLANWVGLSKSEKAQVPWSWPPDNGLDDILDAVRRLKRPGARPGD